MRTTTGYMLYQMARRAGPEVCSLDRNEPLNLNSIWTLELDGPGPAILIGQTWNPILLKGYNWTPRIMGMLLIINSKGVTRAPNMPPHLALHLTRRITRPGVMQALPMYQTLNLSFRTPAVHLTGHREVGVPLKRIHHPILTVKQILAPLLVRPLLLHRSHGRLARTHRLWMSY